MLDCAECIVVGALERKESRGAQFRTRLPRAQRRRVAQAHRPCRVNGGGRARSRLRASDHHQVGAPGADVLESRCLNTRCESAATPPRSGEAAHWEDFDDRPRRAPLGARRDPPGARTARTARSASAARAAPRSAAPAACASTASRARLPHAPRQGRRDGVRRRDRRRADGQHARAQGPDRRHGRGPLEEDPARHAVAAPRGRPARARVHRAPGVDGRRHADDGLHPVRRLRLGLPVDGGRPAVHRPGRAGQGLPLRRRPARRPASTSASRTSPRTRTASTTARTASTASRRARRASRR